MSVRGAVLGVVLLLSACVTRPLDPFAVAEQSLRRQDLADALQALDAVPVAHVRYPEARAAALEVERNMRRCHELMLEAMLLRSEWRDGEALTALQKVREIWPQMPGVAVLIAATAQRQKLFGEAPRVAAAPVPAAPALEPAATPVAEPVHGGAKEPAAELALEAATAAVAEAPAFGEPEVTPIAAAVPAAEPAPLPATVVPEDPGAPSGGDAIALGLVAVEARLGRGQLEGAVVDLLELARRYPGDARVRLRLVRLLHQRALMRYGEGAVAQAIVDWQRVLELDPANVSARRLLEAAQLEGR